MVSDIFCSWLRNINEKFKKESRKIILLLDNCGSHFNLSLSNVKLIFIPPTTSSPIQPLDAGIIKNFKDNYRRILMNQFLVTDKISLNEVFKNISMRDVIFWSKIAWNNVKIETIKNVLKIHLI
jgi:hypothetical protein